MSQPNIYSDKSNFERAIDLDFNPILTGLAELGANGAAEEVRRERESRQREIDPNFGEHRKRVKWAADQAEVEAQKEWKGIQFDRVRHGRDPFTDKEKDNFIRARVLGAIDREIAAIKNEESNASSFQNNGPIALLVEVVKSTPLPQISEKPPVGSVRLEVHAGREISVRDVPIQEFINDPKNQFSDYGDINCRMALVRGAMAAGDRTIRSVQATEEDIINID